MLHLEIEQLSDDEWAWEALESSVLIEGEPVLIDCGVEFCKSDKECEMLACQRLLSNKDCEFYFEKIRKKIEYLDKSINIKERKVLSQSHDLSKSIDDIPF